MTLPVVDPSVFADARSLANLKREVAARDPQALRSAARQFESLFIDMMLKSARAANFKDPLFGSSQQRFYQDLYDQQLSIELSKTHTFGLAEMLVQQLRRQWATPGGGASTANGTASPAGASTAAASGLHESNVPPLGTAAGGIPPPRPSTNATEATPSTSGTDAIGPSQQIAFAQSLWPDAQRAARQLGVSPVSLIAQAALETDWGRSLPRSATGQTSNNLFGIKASGAWRGASVHSATHEYVNGATTAVQAPFRAYGSCSQCFEDYTALLRSDPRYAGALGTGNDVGAFASALQRAGYATDPNYARKLTAVAATLNRTLAAQPAAGPLKLAAVPPMTTGSSTL